MWPRQADFRMGVQATLEQVLRLLGAQLDPRVVLVGIADAPGAGHAISIEPATGPLRPDHLADVGVRSEPAKRNPARAAAVAEAIEASETMPGKHLMVSPSGRVGTFELHTCVALDQQPLARVPTLEGEQVAGLPAPPSFLRHAVDLVLQEADVALSVPDPGSDAVRRSPHDLVREAAVKFCDGCSYRSGVFGVSHLYESLNAITSRTYEGMPAAGRLLLVAPDHRGLEVLTSLRHPVPLSAHRAVRKLLETTDHSLALLVHEGGVFGMGRLHQPAQSQAADVFEVVVSGHATWELSNGGNGYLRVAYRQPSLPRPILNATAIADTIVHVLGGAADLDRLMDLASAAGAARHGSTLVLSADAAGESQRLAGQATPIHPVALTLELFERHARIDGAILLDPAGVCHAIGAILDGPAPREGDPARGSRYNSAVRYQASARAPTVVLVASEDGGVVTVPHLMARIHRQDVVDAVARLEHTMATGAPDQFADAFERVQSLAFYLSPEQCERVNSVAAAEHDERVRAGRRAVPWPKLRPDPLCDQSYLLDPGGPRSLPDAWPVDPRAITPRVPR